MLKNLPTLSRVAAVTLLALLPIAATTGCSSNEPVKPKKVAEQTVNKDGKTSNPNGVEAVSPQIVILDKNIDGQKVHVEPNTNVILASPAPEGWTGASADEAILTFVPGEKQDDYTTNASLQVHRDGETTVTVKNGKDAYTFTVVSVFTETDAPADEDAEKETAE